jgi:hypothetical protein
MSCSPLVHRVSKESTAYMFRSNARCMLSMSSTLKTKDSQYLHSFEAAENGQTTRRHISLQSPTWQPRVQQNTAKYRVRCRATTCANLGAPSDIAVGPSFPFPLLHTHLPPPAELCHSHEQAAPYHILSLQVRGIDFDKQRRVSNSRTGFQILSFLLPAAPSVLDFH